MSDNGKRGGAEPIVPLKDADAFWLTDLYPDAKALFEHEQVSLDSASQDCIVVLDANVLLLPFEFNSASVGEVERVYKDLCAAGNLVVPGQAAREFYRNRSNKITAIADAIDAAITKSKKQIFEKSIPLLESDPDYEEARKLGKELVAKGLEVAAKLDAVNLRLKDEIGADRVSVLYRALLGGCISEVPAGTADERKAISEEVSRRARLKIAPGYKDKQKEDGGIGDYLVWQSILQEGQKRKVHCIFVTEEEKPDWWIKRNGTFQPRPELIEEYRRASDGKSLHLVPLSGLLAVFKANSEVVKQVQDVEDKNKITLFGKKGINHLINNNAFHWSDFNNSADLLVLLKDVSDNNSEYSRALKEALLERSSLSPSEFDAALIKYREIMDNDDTKRAIWRLRHSAPDSEAKALAELNRHLFKDTKETSLRDYKDGDDD